MRASDPRNGRSIAGEPQLGVGQHRDVEVDCVREVRARHGAGAVVRRGAHQRPGRAQVVGDLDADARAAEPRLHDVRAGERPGRDRRRRTQTRGSAASPAACITPPNASLSMPSAAPAALGPVYRAPARSSAACRVPSSPGPPWQQFTTALISSGPRRPSRPPRARSRRRAGRRGRVGARRGGTPSTKAARSQRRRRPRRSRPTGPSRRR